MHYAVRAHLVPLLLLCCACGGPPSPHEAAIPPHTTTAYLRIAPAQSRHRLRVGEPLVLRLETSAASGYAWSFIGPLPSILRMERDPAQVPMGRPGGGTVQTWTFRAQRAGHARLCFVHQRPWEARSVAPVHREFDVWVE